MLLSTICVVLAALAVFAVELGQNQTRSRHDIEVQIHDRAVLAGALIDSLFGSVVQASPAPVYDQAVVTDADIDQATENSSDSYTALLDADGRVVAHSSSMTAAAIATLDTSQAVSIVRSGRPYGLGDLRAYSPTGAVDIAVRLSTPFGTRLVVAGLPAGSGATALGGFLSSDLRTIPGVGGEINYVVDGNGVVLASTSSHYPVDARISQPGALAALAGGTSDRNGTYFAHVAIGNSRWQIVLAAPDGPLFASVTGVRQLVPWLIFAAFALVAMVAMVLGWRVLRTAARLQVANHELGRVNEDLTEANSSLERRAAELARSNEELDQFASIASHDLQEPLRKVRTFTEQLNVLEGDRISEKGHEYLDRANAAAERMQRLVEDLLRFSRVSTQGRPFIAVDLGEVARLVVDDLDSQISEAGAIVRIGELPTIDADPVQMQQLFQNLVSNAIKFRRDGVVPEVDIDATVHGTTAVLKVRDNGIGFEPRYAQRIFRIFERLHGRIEYPGTGIGLALCRKIVDRHGGTITADSDPGEGALFTVVVPVGHPADGSAHPGDGSSHPDDGVPGARPAAGPDRLISLSGRATP